GSCTGGNGSGAWKLSSHCLKNLANEPSVKFRFTFGSGTTCNDYDGLAFDDFLISEAPTFPDDINYSCIDGRTINFSDANLNCHTQWLWDFGDPSSPNNSSTADSVDHVFSSGG